MCILLIMRSSKQKTLPPATGRVGRRPCFGDRARMLGRTNSKQMNAKRIMQTVMFNIREHVTFANRGHKHKPNHSDQASFASESVQSTYVSQNIFQKMYQTSSCPTHDSATHNIVQLWNTVWRKVRPFNVESGSQDWRLNDERPQT